MVSKMIGYDPIELGNHVLRYVSRVEGGVEYRRYYRFRGGKWYGGIATADCVGCNLRCRFCWSWNKGSHVLSTGSLYSPEEVAARLVEIARSRGYKYVRLSGAEPTLTQRHLIQVLEHLRSIGKGLKFILETNGILLGHNRDYAFQIASFKNIIVRVSLKGTNPEEFHRLTGARPDAFELQIRALENLVEAGLKPGEQVYPAIMLSFSTEDNVKALLRRLSEIHPQLAREVDPEFVILYPHVIQLLKKFGLRPIIAYTPDNIPKFMI